jgi:hypothetical protein
MRSIVHLLVAISGVATTLVSCQAAARSGSETAGGATSRADADAIRATERTRLRALVDANVDVARQLHADDFQLITPSGTPVSKDQYLGGIAAGQVDYLFWEADSIAVRLYGNAAVIRYPSQLEIIFQGQHISRRRYWHTDAYERRYGRWQVVWSQATEIR